MWIHIFPQAFRYSDMAAGFVPEIYLANGIVLRHHFVVDAESASPEALKLIANRLGGADKIHSFSGAAGGSAGSHHCMTQVIRD